MTSDHSLLPKTEVRNKWIFTSTFTFLSYNAYLSSGTLYLRVCTIYRRNAIVLREHDKFYRGADKSIARQGRKQANVSVRMAWISFVALPCRGKKKTTWWQLASRCCWNRARPWHASELVSFLVGLRTYQHHGRYRYGCFVPCPSSGNIINYLFSPELHILQKEDESDTSQVSWGLA